MAASIGWYDTDDTTALSSVDLGAVPPGDSYFGRNGVYAQVRVKNDGTEAFTTVNIEIQQVSTYAAYQYLRIAPDDGLGAPGVFQDYTANPLALGGMAAGAIEPVWIDAIVPGSAGAEEGQLSNLVTIATL